jgi:hypothetical protein
LQRALSYNSQTEDKKEEVLQKEENLATICRQQQQLKKDEEYKTTTLNRGDLLLRNLGELTLPGYSEPPRPFSFTSPALQVSGYSDPPRPFSFTSAIQVPTMDADPPRVKDRDLLNRAYYKAIALSDYPPLFPKGAFLTTSELADMYPDLYVDIGVPAVHLPTYDISMYPTYNDVGEEIPALPSVVEAEKKVPWE